MAHDDEHELTYADFSRYPGAPGGRIQGLGSEPPLPSYSEDDDDAVTVAMRPLEEQLAQPGLDLAWMRAPAVALPAPIMVQPPAVVLPAPPVARAPSVRPAALAVTAPPASWRPPTLGTHEPAPSPAAPATRAEPVASPSAPAVRASSPGAPAVRAVLPASPPPAAVRAGAAAAHMRPVRQRKPDLLLLLLATALCALVMMLGTGAVLYRIGVFQPGSASATH